MSTSAVERRIDPDDGKAYSLKELELKYEGEFSREEVEDFWHDECQPLISLSGKGSGASRAARLSRDSPPALNANMAKHLRSMSLADWLDQMDAQWLRLLPASHQVTAGVRTLLPSLEDMFDTPTQIMTLYLKRGPDGKKVLDDDFFEDAGIVKIGQKRVVNRWVSENC
eukprot:gnl/TRDRNA2_/TRDRNA2_175099_c0_seq1.p1 gnl/TRDRNA2_/TRDRNA2_175099_c0~~gnl/TRDRNA2_/TRDRNA2_175099_c0_seq1.p1  ORF type:complete len:169 (+),score=29.37 gnl/TRDRNA2_/TRDRNA2_175099_c0_seq1:143-649(+)